MAVLRCNGSGIITYECRNISGTQNLSSKYYEQIHFHHCIIFHNKYDQKPIAGHPSDSIYISVAQSTQTICCAESVLEVNWSWLIKIMFELPHYFAFDFCAFRNRFFNGHSPKLRSDIWKADCIGTIKFFGRQHGQLVNIMNKINACYSFQVWESSSPLFLVWTFGQI